MRPVRRIGRRRDESGAAAVEFALVVPVLLLVLFGIVDFGLYFSDSLAGQSGVRDATRQAVTASFTACSSPLHGFDSHPGGSVPSTDMKDLACMVASRTSAIAGKVYVDIVLPPPAATPADPSQPTDQCGPPGATPGAPGWNVCQPLTVCETIVATGVSGLIPLPNDSSVRSKSVMTIEDPASNEVGGEQQLPSGLNWDWCGP
jgi:Flp pilus assembly pilin Flp